MSAEEEFARHMNRRFWKDDKDIEEETRKAIEEEKTRSETDERPAARRPAPVPEAGYHPPRYVSPAARFAEEMDRIFESRGMTSNGR